MREATTGIDIATGRDFSVLWRWKRPRVWPHFAAIALLAVIALALLFGLAGCMAADVETTGTVAGNARASVEPRFPHPMAERSSRRVTTTAPAGDVVDECDTCEGGTCKAPSR